MELFLQLETVLQLVDLFLYIVRLFLQLVKLFRLLVGEFLLMRICPVARKAVTLCCPNFCLIKLLL